MRRTLTLSSVSYTQQNVMKSIFLLHTSIDIKLNTKSVKYRKVAVPILSITLVFKIKKGTAKGKSVVSFNLYFVA